MAEAQVRAEVMIADRVRRILSWPLKFPLIRRYFWPAYWLAYWTFRLIIFPAYLLVIFVLFLILLFIVFLVMCAKTGWRWIGHKKSPE